MGIFRSGFAGALAGLAVLATSASALSQAPPQEHSTETSRIQRLEEEIRELRRTQADIKRALDGMKQQAAPTTTPAPPAPLSTSLPVISGFPLKLSGSITARYNRAVLADQTDQLQGENSLNAFQARIRFGAQYDAPNALLNGGVRLSTGESPNPTAPFVSMGDAFRLKSFGLDQYYLSIRPFSDRDITSLTFGAMPNPFWRGDRGTFRTEMIWDDDINPEGVALRNTIYSTSRTNPAFKIDNVIGYFVLTDVPNFRFVGKTSPAFLAAEQLRFYSKFVSGAVAYYHYGNLNTGLVTTSFVPGQGAFVPAGNVLGQNAFLLRPGLQFTNNHVNFGPSSDGFYKDTFRILNLNAQAHLPIPLKHMGDSEVWLFGDYSHNFATDFDDACSPTKVPVLDKPTVAEDHPQTAGQFDKPYCSNNGFGVTLGVKAGSYAKDSYINPLNLWVTYRNVDADAALGTFADSDLGGGTAYKGVEVGVNYRVHQHLMLLFSYFNYAGYPLKDVLVQRGFGDVVLDF